MTLSDPSQILASQWRQIVNSARDTAIISTDASGLVTSWNCGAENILGWSEAEMLGQSLERIFLSADRDGGKLQREMNEAIATGRGGGDEGWRQHKNGSAFWATGEMSPIRSEEKKQIVGFIKILRDRTARREVEQIAAEERRALELLNRAGSALAAESELQKIVQIVTDVGVELTGAEFGAFFYNVQNEVGESYMLYTLAGAPLEAFSKFPMPRNTEIFAPTFEGQGIVRSSDITADPRYGKNHPRKGMPEGHLPVRSYLAVPVKSRTGEVIGGLFFGHKNIGVFSERSERGLAGLSAEAAVAIDNARLSADNKRELAKRIKAEEELRRLNISLEATVEQRTEQLRAKDEALRQAQKMEAVGQLTGGVAHDFNNLLQIVIGNLETLQRNLPTEAGRLKRAATNAMSGAQRAATLTQRLLAFARRQPLDPKLLNLNSLVQGVSEMISRTIGERISVETVQGAGLWQVEVDPGELESAILNLSINARDAMVGGGKLTIETANVHVDDAYAKKEAEVLPGQYVAVSVTDEGQGMDRHTIEQAFEPFFTTKPVGQGTGLGLSQVYGFVKQSGGHVKIYSEVGQGTTVRLYLPRFSAANDAAPEVIVPEAAAETILVLEDDPDVREYSVETLRELGYSVLEAHDGATALRLLETETRIDLLFSDVVLPGGLSGSDVATKAAALRPKLKVLFTTGYARNAIVHQGRLDRGVQLLTKPFSYNDLAEKIRDVLDS